MINLRRGFQKYLFATGEGKTHPKIPFNFPLPRNQPQQKLNKKIPKINLRKQNAKSMLQQYTIKYKEDVPSLENPNTISSIYNYRFEKKLQIADATKNFIKEQYIQGQELIENVPLDPFYQYKIAEFLNKLEQTKKQIDNFLNLETRNNMELSSKYRSMIDTYDQKLKKSEFDSYQKYLREYPGSIKGPNPQDDPEAYFKYAMLKIPKFLKEKQQLQRLKMNNQQVDEQQYQQYKVQFESVRDILGQNREIKAPQKHFMPGQLPFILPKEEVPLMPNVYFIEYQQFMMQLTAWSHFRFSYYMSNLKRLLKQNFKLLNKILILKNPRDPKQTYIQIPPSATSLYRYYKCLPKQLQDHAGVKNIYLGLQYSSPDFTQEQKQQALNKAAQFCLPMDKLSTRIMDTFVAKKKVYPTPYLKEKLFKMSPQFTWDIWKFFQEIKDQELRGIVATPEQKEQKYHTPPEVHKQWAQNGPQLPVDFYDNQDGFWDPIISKKLQRYDKAQPMIKKRKHFTH